MKRSGPQPVTVIFPMAGQAAHAGFKFKPFVELSDEPVIAAVVRPFLKWQSAIDRFVFVTLAERGIRIARDLDVAVHAHAADCHGVSLEFFDDSFHDNEDLLDRPMQSAAYWREHHPLGITGLRGYTVAVADLASALADFLAERGIGTGRHYPEPIHLSRAYASLGYTVGQFPVSERLAKEALSLPLFAGMQEEQVDRVVRAVRDYFSG